MWAEAGVHKAVFLSVFAVLILVFLAMSTLPSILVSWSMGTGVLEIHLEDGPWALGERY